MTESQQPYANNPIQSASRPQYGEVATPDNAPDGYYAGEAYQGRFESGGQSQQQHHAPQPQKKVKRLRNRVVAFAATFILCWLVLLAGFSPSPWLIEKPGPVYEIVGKHNKPLFRVLDKENHPVSGRMNMLTVSLYGTPEHHSSWFDAIGAMLDKKQHLVNPEELYPKGMTDKQIKQQSTAEMSSAQDDAGAAALINLGYPVKAEVRIGSIGKDGAAVGKLESGDLVLGINGTPVTGVAQMKQLTQENGENPLHLQVQRNGKTLDIEVTPKRAKDNRVYVGVSLQAKYDLPVTIKYEVDGVGGPSAGMMFALSIINTLTTGEMTGGHNVSGTGTIDADGNVGPIGGLPQKMWAAANAGTEFFIMPVDNCEDLPDGVPNNMPVAAVKTLNEAKQALQKFVNHEDLSQYSCKVTGKKTKE